MSIPLNNNQIAHWLSGFTDAEGNFSIEYNDKTNYFKFRFKFTLHKDDIEVLKFLKKNTLKLAIFNLL